VGHGADVDAALAHSMVARMNSKDDSDSDLSDYTRRQQRTDETLRKFYSSDSEDDYVPSRDASDSFETVLNRKQPKKIKAKR